jgi:hypothetical protein
VTEKRISYEKNKAQVDAALAVRPCDLCGASRVLFEVDGAGCLSREPVHVDAEDGRSGVVFCGAQERPIWFSVCEDCSARYSDWVLVTHGDPPLGEPTEALRAAMLDHYRAHCRGAS